MDRKANGWNENFYNTNATNIILHKAARKYFEDLGIEKLPPISTLKQEWATLEAERKKLYATYREIKDSFVVLGTAKSNASHMLGITDDGQVQNKILGIKTQHNRVER